jgi:riboflavin synthase
LFTGLIQETGRITSLEKLSMRRDTERTRITVASLRVPSQLAAGDSVAVSGVCLTAVAIDSGKFSADLAEETLQRTSLARLQLGALVNLELPARAQDRLGGHVVQGHIDGVGKLLRLEKVASGEDWRLAIRIPPNLGKYVVSQGSIAIEGISLTVAKIDDDELEIAIIPHTYQATNLHALRSGDPMNIEVDVLAKYTEKMSRGAGGKLTVEDLVRRGF